MKNNYNACRNYAKTWAKNIDSKYVVYTKKTGVGTIDILYVSSIYNGNDYIGKLEFSHDGKTNWSEWAEGKGYIYTQPVDLWK